MEGFVDKFWNTVFIIVIIQAIFSVIYLIVNYTFAKHYKIEPSKHL